MIIVPKNLNACLIYYLINKIIYISFLGSAMFNIENTQPSRRWQTLHIIYGNTPRSVSKNVLENNIFF